MFKTEITLFQFLNHQEYNLKVRLIIKSGYYIVPNPSTILKSRLLSFCRYILLVPPFSNIPSPDMCAQDAAKVHFDIDTSFFPHFQYYIWSAFSPQSAINSLQKNGSDSDSPGIVVF